MTTATAQGARVYFVGHSFHMFVIRPLITLAKEAGIKGHWAQGWDMIGGSTPTQHWERGGETNEVKDAIATGEVEVLTLATNVLLADPAVDAFADLAVAHNPQVRVLLQHSWGDRLTSAIMRVMHGLTPETAPQSPEDRAAFMASVGSNDERDDMTTDDITALRKDGQGIEVWRAQLDGINERHGRDLAHLVPVNDAVLHLRQAVLDGEVPGVSRQSELFQDVLGHAAPPITDLVTYQWLAAIYGVNPTGLTGLVDAADPTSAPRQAVLQELAWSSLLDEPASGINA